MPLEDANGNPIRGKQFEDAEGKPLVFKPWVSELNPAESPQNAPYVGRLTANSLPMVGSFAGAGGTLIGTGISQRLRRNWPGLFGAPPADTYEGVAEAGKDLVLNNAIPKGIGMLGKLATQIGMDGVVPTVLNTLGLTNLPGARQILARTVSKELLDQIERRSPHALLGQAAENIPYGEGSHTPIRLNDAGRPYTPISFVPEKAPVVPIKINELENPSYSQIKPGGKRVQQYGPPTTEVLPGQQIQKPTGNFTVVPGETKLLPGGDVSLTRLPAKLKEVNSFPGLNSIIEDPSTLKKTLEMAELTFGPEKRVALRQTLQEYQAQRMIHAATSLDKDGIPVVSADRLRTELSNPKLKESLQQLYGDGGLKPIHEFAGELQKLEDGHGLIDGIVRYSNHRLIWATAALGGMHSILGLPGLTAAGLTLTNARVAKILSNPETAQLVVQAMRTPASAPQAGLINQMLQRAFKVGADLATVPDNPQPKGQMVAQTTP